MKILVTGGAGFIGSHIVDACLAAGHDVVVIDDLSSGRRQWVSPEARLVELDIRDPRLDRVFQEERPEVVFHEAARANVRESMDQPLLYADVNVLGSLHVLECSRRHEVRKIVYASTGGAVYGEPRQLPVFEDHPINPVDPYGASKHHVEHYLHLYRRNFGLQYTVLRYPNVYGPRQDPYGEAGVVAIFAQQMLTGGQPTINGSGDQQRDFVHVSDVVSANLLALEKGDGAIYNVGSGAGTSVNQIFEHLSRLTGSGNGNRLHGPSKPGEVFQIYLDATRARRDLEWSPKVELAEGLRSTVEHFKAHLSVSYSQ